MLVPAERRFLMGYRLELATILTIIGLAVTVLTLVSGGVAAFVKLSARVENLEKAQDEIRADIRDIKRQLWELSISKGE